MPTRYWLPHTPYALSRWRSRLVLAAVALPALLFAAVAVEDYRSVVRDARQSIRTTTGVFAEQAHNVFQTHELIARQVDEHIRGMSWDEIAASLPLHRYLAALAGAYGQTDSLWLVDGNGDIRASSAMFPLRPVSVADRDDFTALRARDSGSIIGPLVSGRIGGRTNFNVMRRRSTASGAFDGVVVVSAVPSYFTAFWEQASGRQGGEVSLIRADGAFLARLPALAVVPARLPDGSALRQAIAAGEAGEFRAVSSVDGQERLYAYRRIAGAPVYVSYGVAMRSVLAHWRGHLIYYGAMFAGGGLCLAWLAMVGIAPGRREAAALALAERFRVLIEAVPDPMILVRGDGVVSLVNSRTLEAFGYASAEIVGQPVETLLPEAVRARHVAHRAEYARQPRKREMGSQLKLLARRKDGSLFPVDVSLSPLEIAGEPLVMAMVRDVTLRREMENAIEASRLQLATAARMSALGAMAGGIAHEINNPLMIIHAAATDLYDLAEEGRATRAEVLTYSGKISQYSERISRIVRSMLHLARDGGGDPLEPVALREIVDEALDLCRQRFVDNDVALMVASDGLDNLVSCRAGQIGQVVINLLQNALDAVMLQQGPRWVRLEVERLEGRVVLSVTDSGTGLPPEVAARIMEPFFTTKPVGHGTGLGLSISRQIAIDHGGTLTAGLRGGHTCFALSLASVSEVMTQ